MLPRLSGPLWAAVRLTLMPVVQLNATSAFRAVVAAEPADADEALDKTLYLMAILLADSEKVDGELMRRATRSFAPFRATVSSALMNQDDRGSSTQNSSTSEQLRSSSLD
jgi:hypothetical protein